MSKNSTFTQNQLFTLLGMVAIIILILGIAVVYIFVKKDPPIINSSVATSVTSSANIIALPTNLLLTATPVSTFAYLPTSTPIPSPTSFVLAPLERPTQKPQQAQNNPVNPPSGNAVPNCSAELDYAAAMHQWYLDSIDYIHSPLINYYQNLINEMVADSDALGFVKAQRELENEQAQVNAEKGSENKRYKAERASINANCH
jgi:hypothetical protein